MKAIVTINKNLAILAGHENFGEKEIEFKINELNKEQREELVKVHSKSEKYDMSAKEYQSNYSIDSDLREKYEKTGIENPGIDFIKKILNCRIEIKKEQKIRSNKKSEMCQKEREKMIAKKREYIESEIGNGINTGLIEYRSYHYSIDNSISDYLTENEKKLLNELIQNKKEKSEKELKEKELKEEQAENVKKEWIKENGSDRLIRGMIAKYNINRLYVQEKSEVELSKFGTVIFDSKEEIAIKDRNCPSLENLRLEEKIKKAGYKCEIVWCIDNRNCEYYGERDQYEAIWIKFLDKYDVFIK